MHHDCHIFPEKAFYLFVSFVYICASRYKIQSLLQLPAEPPNWQLKLLSLWLYLQKSSIETHNQVKFTIIKWSLNLQVGSPTIQLYGFSITSSDVSNSSLKFIVPCVKTWYFLKHFVFCHFHYKYDYANGVLMCCFSCVSFVSIIEFVRTLR